MEVLAELKEKIRGFYARFDIYFDMFFKFAFALITLLVIKDRFGFFQELSNPILIVIISLFCAIVPWSIITTIMAIVVLLNVYKISLLMTIVLALVMLIIGLVYFGFHPGNSYLMVLTPLMFALNIPFLLPILVGLGGTFASSVTVAIGILIYYLLAYILGHPVTVKLTEIDDVGSAIKLLFKSLTSNKTMLLLMLIFAVTIIIVYIIRHLSIDYSWYIAVGAGMVVMLLLTLLGIKKLGMELDLLSAVLGIAVGTVVALIAAFFVFSLDFKRTERTQFEDENYYYYVKAVPKMGVHPDDYYEDEDDSRN